MSSKKTVRSFIPSSRKIKKGSKLQSVVFLPTSKNKWTIVKAKQWLKEHNVRTIKSVDIVKNKFTGKPKQLRFRVQDPNQFSRFITKRNRILDIHFVVGFI